MRRLLALLLLVVGIGALAPCAPVTAASPRHHAGMAVPADCHDDATVVAHGCVGCAIAPDPVAPVPATPVREASRYPVRAVAVPLVRPTGFDPPPPRRVA